MAKPNSRFDFEEANQATKQLVSQTPKWLQLSFIRSWMFWAAIFIGERLESHELAGGALIIAGVIVGEAGGAWVNLRAARAKS